MKIAVVVERLREPPPKGLGPFAARRERLRERFGALRERRHLDAARSRERVAQRLGLARPDVKHHHAIILVVVRLRELDPPRLIARHLAAVRQLLR